MEFEKTIVKMNFKQRNKFLHKVVFFKGLGSAFSEHPDTDLLNKVYHFC